MMRLILAALCLATPLSAQTVSTCDWRASAGAIAEPWEEMSRTFAGGAIRVALADTEEPAAAALHLIVLHNDPAGYRRCDVVSADGSLGFAALYFEDLTADYDPAKGLTVTVPGHRVWAGESYNSAIRLHVTINQATGTVTARQELPPQ